MDSQATYGVSKRGKKTLLYRGFEFWFHKELKNGSVVWRCCKGQALKCKAMVISRDLVVAGNKDPSHSHESNNSRGLARRAVGEMKQRLQDTLATPSATQAAVTATLPDHVLMALPKKTTLSRALRLHRQKSHDSRGAAMPPVPQDTDFDIPQRFADFVQHDSGAGTDRIIVFGCAELLDGLARATMWLADGTFKVVPTLFFQLYTIHFQSVNGVNPAALYCLLPNKTRATYDRLVSEIRRLIPLAAPAVILTDFETAAMSAFRQAYPNARITGCYFHLAQSVIRRVGEVGLKSEYENRDDLRLAIRSLAALSHVPVADVAESFDLLAESMPDADRIDEVVTYFEHTYVRGRRLPGRGDHYRPALFPIETWNQTQAAGDGLARTNNICEGWHHGLQCLLQCSHPSMWRFLEGLLGDCAKQKASFLQALTGVQHPAEKRYRLLSQRTVRAIGAYGQTDVLTFLRAIAHLSYQ